MAAAEVEMVAGMVLVLAGGGRDVSRRSGGGGIIGRSGRGVGILLIFFCRVFFADRNGRDAEVLIFVFKVLSGGKQVVRVVAKFFALNDPCRAGGGCDFMCIVACRTEWCGGCAVLLVVSCTMRTSYLE